jgi:hypothetical protein
MDGEFDHSSALIVWRELAGGGIVVDTNAVCDSAPSSCFGAT